MTATNENYSSLQECANRLRLFQLLLSNFEADQADDERRYWIGNVQLTAFWICSDEENAWSTSETWISYGKWDPRTTSFPAHLFTIRGRRRGRAWSEDEGHQTNKTKVIFKVTEELLKFRTRQKKKDFVAKHQQLAKTLKANLSEKYLALRDDNSAAASRLKKKQCERIAEFIELL